jgi:DNA-binding transcriptional regulator LsrR (DeoR family)
MIVQSSSALAAMLNVTPTTVHRWIRRGMPHKLVGIQYNIELESALRWIEQVSPRHKIFIEDYRQKKAPATTEALRNPAIKTTTTKTGGID